MVGQPFWPYFMLKGQAWFFFIFGALVVLSTFAQINPVWLYGPYTPLAISSASQPDWYMGILEGALRIMPAWEINFLGHTLTLSVLIPFAVPLGHHLHRRRAVAVLRGRGRPATSPSTTSTTGRATPRSAPGPGVAAVASTASCGPRAPTTCSPTSCRSRCTRSPGSRGWRSSWCRSVAYFVTKRICLGLQRKDAELLHPRRGDRHHPPAAHGEFIEEARPLTEEERAVIGSKQVPVALPGPGKLDRQRRYPRPPPAAPSAGRAGSPTAPSPRPSRSRTGTATGTATTTGTPSRKGSTPLSPAVTPATTTADASARPAPRMPAASIRGVLPCRCLTIRRSRPSPSPR